MSLKALFVCSGRIGISPIVWAQGQSLIKIGVRVEFFTIKNRGIKGYLASICPLHRLIKESNPDIVHAHYSLCGIVASLATRKPVITSLMGSDVKGSGFWRTIIRFSVCFVWHSTIVKSEDMKKSLDLKTSKIHVIPNGVDLNLFRPMDKIKCREKVGWDLKKKIVLFAADPKRLEKNYSLAKAAIDALYRSNVELKVVYDVAHECMPLFMNAADALLLTSLWEGSPNVVKEAMACCLSIVSTDVGDVRWLLDGLDGCSVAPHDPHDILFELDLALQFKSKTKGRDRLMELGLDSDSVAVRIINIYDEVFMTESKNYKGM